jgi:UPF0755 protein
LGGALIGASALGGLFLAAQLPLQRGAPDRIIEIRKGAGLLEISWLLEEEGVLWRREVFTLLALLQGDRRRLQAGEYRLSASLSPARILEMLRRGEVLRHALTIPEGFTLAEVARATERVGLAKASELLSLSRDRGFLAELALDAPSLEGYLFPETYFFSKGTPARALLRQMVETLRARFTEEIQERGKALGLTPHQVLTLASLIERETPLEEERRLVSAVFHNRLRRGIRLQADPTVLYALGRTGGPLTKEDLQVNSPYNTYLHRGLPPGPIASSGIASLRAAVDPAPVGYLYFVARGDGGHEFTLTLAEHEEAIRRSRRAR